jgi:hypothetical protein
MECYFDCFTIRVFGRKEVYFVKNEDGSWLASCACWVTNADVQIPLTEAQACELASIETEGQKRLIQDILPDVPPLVREIFVSGLTPAEFDMACLGTLQSNEVYKKLGLCFSGMRF